MAQVTFHVLIHEEDDGTYWSEVMELPGCFASGFSLEELQEATFEAIQLVGERPIRDALPRFTAARGVDLTKSP